MGSELAIRLVTDCDASPCDHCWMARDQLDHPDPEVVRRRRTLLHADPYRVGFMPGSPRVRGRVVPHRLSS